MNSILLANPWEPVQSALDFFFFCQVWSSVFYNIYIYIYFFFGKWFDFFANMTDSFELYLQMQGSITSPPVVAEKLVSLEENGVGSDKNVADLDKK